MARNSNDVTTRILDIQVRYEDALDQIAAYRKAIEETKARQKELKKELDEGTITQAEYGRQMEASRISIAEQNNSINTLTKQIRNQQKVEQEQLGSLVQLRAQLSNLNADYDRLSKKSERERKVMNSLIKSMRPQQPSKQQKKPLSAISEMSATIQAMRVRPHRQQKISLRL